VNALSFSSAAHAHRISISVPSTYINATVLEHYM